MREILHFIELVLCLVVIEGVVSNICRAYIVTHIKKENET